MDGANLCEWYLNLLIMKPPSLGYKSTILAELRHRVSCSCSFMKVTLVFASAPSISYRTNEDIIFYVFVQRFHVTPQPFQVNRFFSVIRVVWLFHRILHCDSRSQHSVEIEFS